MNSVIILYRELRHNAILGITYEYTIYTIYFKKLSVHFYFYDIAHLSLGLGGKYNRNSPSEP